MTTTPDAIEILGAVRALDAIDVDEPTDTDTKFFSVTTILKALSNPALDYWAVSTTAAAAIDSQATWRAMIDDAGRPETIKWLSNARYRQPKLTLSAADLGTCVHKLAEHYALTGEKPDREFTTNLVASHAAPTIDIDAEVHIAGQMLSQFDNFLQKFSPEYTAAEMSVFSQEFGYAGQLDAILTIDGVRLLCDYKTRREPLDKRGNPQKPYGETALQLSAYRHADTAAVWRARRFEKQSRRYYLLNDSERTLSARVPEVDAGICLLITPQSCTAYPMKCDEEVFNSFLYVAEAWRFQEDLSKRVVGDPLVPLGEGA